MNDKTAELDVLLGALKAALDAEYAALTQREPDHLIAAVEEKTRLLTALEQATGSYAGDGHDLPPQWAELQQQVAECAERNRINGGAIALNRGLVSGLLETLLGGKPGPATYTASGKLGVQPKARPVGQV